MNTKNTFVKKLTALVLCLCMVLPMVTTGFAPMMALLDGIAPEADAAVTEKGKVAFYVPEVIYLYPEARSGAQATATPFQYYVENNIDGNDYYKTPTTSTELKSTGSIYFATTAGFSDISLSYKFVDANGSALSGGSVTTSDNGKQSAGGGDFYYYSITGGTSPSLAAATTGCYLEWTVSYTNNAGERQSAIAYTYVYKPYIYPVAAGTEAGTGTSGGANWAGSVLWISGFHFITPVSTSQGNSFDESWFNHYTKENFMGFISKDNVGYANGTRYTGSQAKITSGFTTNPTSTGGSLGYAVFTGSSASGQYLQVATNSNPSYLASSSAGTYTPASGLYNYSVTKYRGNKADIQTTCYEKSYGNLYIDTSRYGNLNQIPNLGVGFMVTDDESSAGGTGNWYVADFTGREPGYFNIWYEGSGNRDTLYNDRGTVIAAQPTGSLDRSYDETEGIRYAGAWPRALTGSTGTQGATAVYRVKGFYANMDEDWLGSKYDAQGHTLVEMKATYYNKSTLRTAVNNAINAMSTLGLKDNYGSYYYDTNSTAWKNFISAYKAAAMALTKLDGAVSNISTIVTNLNNAVSALKAGQSRKITFDVNYGGINPNYYILGTAANGGYGLTTTYNADESVTLNGTISGSNEFGKTPFTPTVNSYTFSATLLSGSMSGDGCVVLDSSNDSNANISTRSNFDFTGTSQKTITYNYTLAQETDFLRFWQWKNQQNTVYDNLTVRIKVEKGSAKTAYSPATRIATTSGTYGTLPTPDARPGYTFKGWATTATGTTTVTSSTTVTSDTLYAIWEPNTYNVTFDNLFDFSKFTPGTDSTKEVSNRTDTGFTMTSLSGTDSNTGFSDFIPVEAGKTYIFSADVEFLQASGGYDMYINTLDANKAGETTAIPDTANGAHREGNVYISLTGQTTNRTPYIRFTAGNSTAYIRIRFDVNAAGNKLTVNNIRVCEDTGVSVSPVNKYVTYDSIYGTLPTPTKTGYIFSKWVDAGSAEYKSTDTVKITDTLALQPVWSPVTYTIRFQGNGNTSGSTADKSMTYDVAANLNTNGYTKTGYTFKEWNTAADGSGTAYANGQSVKNLSSTHNAVVDLYAQWTPNTYTVTFDPLGGTVAPTSQAVTFDAAYGTLPTPTKDGYTFVGWYDTPAFGTQITASSVYKTAGNTTVFAKWTGVEQTLTIDSNGGVNSANLIYNPNGLQSFSGGSDASLSYNIAFDENGAVDIYGNYTGGVGERTATLDLWVYLEAGKTYEYSFTSTNNFSEFYMFPNGETKNFASLNRKTTNNTTYGGQFVCGGSGDVGDNSWNGVATATGWYQLRLDQDCGTASAAEVTYYEISDFVIREVSADAASQYKQPTDTKKYIPDPTRGGYTFSGWTGAGVGNLGTDKYYTFKPGDNALVANWDANTYTITYDADGGTLTGAATQDYTPDEAVTIASAPTRTGYTFNGWLVTVADGNWVENSPCNAGEQTPIGMYGNVTLTAQWSKNSYTYTVEHWQMNLDGTDYYKVETETVTLNTEDTHTFAVKSYTGFTSPEAVTVTVDGTGELTVVYNYTRNKYKVTTAVNNDKAFASVSGAGEYYYGASVTLTATTNVGYTFTNWTKDGTTDANTSASFTFELGAGDVAWTANASAQIVNYTVEHKYENLDGTYATETQTFTAEADTSVTPAFVNKDGFTAVGNTQTVTVKGDGTTTVTYTYTRNSYSFTTIVDGVSTPVTYKYGATVTAPAVPTKTGYTFAGWEGTVPTAMPAYDVTVTAIWNVNTHTIIYMVDGVEVQKVENVAYGSAVTAYDYTAPRGYSFSGWDAEIPATMPDNDLTFNGTTEKLTYNIKATLNGGSINDVFTEYETTYQVDTARFSIPDPVKQGYTFTGWTENGTNLGTALTIDPTDTSFNLRDLNLVATWTESNVNYTVETYIMGIDGNYGTPTTETKQGLTGSTATADTTAKAGFTLDTNYAGYLTSGTIKADGSLVLKVFYKRNQYTVTLTAGKGVASVAGAGTFYYEAPVSISAQLKDGYENLTWSGTVPTTMPNSNVDLTASAAAKTYTISYDLAGGAVSGTNPTSYNVESADITLVNPTRTGYTFAGWTGTGLDAASTSVTIAKGSTGNRSYTATWTPDTYTISYNLNGGSVSTENPTEYTIESASITLNNPTKQGYAFAGWTGTDLTEATETVTVATGSTGNRTYTATWTESNANYTVKHYRQALDGSYPESLLETVVVNSTTGKTETAALKSYDGFTAPDAVEITVLADGSATVEYRYTRNSYKIVYYTVNADDAQIEFKTIEALYEAPVTAITETPTRTGYAFTEWDVTCPATMPLNGLAITALWNPSTFTITYKGIYDDVSKYPATHTFDSETDISAVPTRDGYTFSGWQFNDAPITFENNKIGKRQFSDNFELTATWTADPTNYRVETYLMGTDGKYPETATSHEAKQTVTDAEITAAHVTMTGFTADTEKSVLSGTAAHDGSSVLKLYYSRNQYALTLETGTGVASVTGGGTFYYEQSVTIGASLNAGYKWVNWTNGDAEYSAEQTKTFTMPANALTLTANAETIAYTITVNTNGGALNAAFDKTSYVVTDEDILVPDASKTGYIFNGWKVNGSAPQKSYTIDTANAVNVELVADWTAIEYKITYVLSGGTNGEGNPDKYTIESADITLADPTRTGYKFLGWTEGNTIAAGSIGDKTFTAEWEALGVEYNIVYHFEGFTAGNYESLVNGKGSANADSMVQIADIATVQTGFTFKEAKLTEGGEAVTEFKNGTTNGETTIHLYYTRNSYTVTFDVDGGTAVEAVTYKYDEAVAAPAATTKTGYTFDGWDTLPEKMPAENVTVKALWTINQYTITFANTGDSSIDPITQDYNTAVTAPADPTKTGYTFTGWDKEIPDTMPAEDMTISATWKINQYTVTFDTDGGSEIAPITQDYATAITKPANPTKEGYTFAGWDVAIPELMPAENVTVTAQWTINQYTITFADTGDTVIENITADYGTAVTKPADPTKVGYTFDGWDVAVPDTMPAKDMTITAQWKINQYTITFDSDGGSAVNAIKQDYNTDVTAPTAPTRAGYTFKGWTPAVPATMPAENITLKAEWEIVTYTVSYELNGGENHADNPTTYTYEQSFTLKAPTKVGYTFAGWTPSATIALHSTGDKTFTATWTPNENTPITVEYYIQPVKVNAEQSEYTLHSTDNAQVGTSDAEKEVTPIDIPGFTTPDKRTVTVAADGSSVVKFFYTRNSYTITFDADGGTSVGAITALYEAEVTAPENPTKTGYTFGGWTPALATKMPLNGQSVKAVWTANEYAVTYDYNVPADVTVTHTGNVPGAHTYGTASPVSDPERAGYTFAGWTINGTVNGGTDLTLAAEGYTAPITLKANWTADEQKYTVVYYEENLNGEYVEVNRTTENEADTDSTVTLTPAETKTGFTLNKDKSVLTGIVPVPGTTLELSVYYNRDTYKLTWTVEGVSTTEEYKYEQTIVYPENPTKTGYNFIGWNPTDITTMPAADTTLTAQFAASNHTAYTVIHKLEDLNADTYTVKETELLYGTTATEVTPNVKEYEGFTAPTTQTVTIAADGSTRVEYLYTRNSYDVTIVATDAGLSNATASQKVEFEGTLEVKVDVANGYEFKGWTSDNEKVSGGTATSYTITVPASVVTLTANAEIIKYTVTYDLAGGALADGKINPTEFYVTTEDFTLNNPTKTGYTFLGWTGSNGTTAEETVTVKQGTYQNLNYVANWQINQYTITYDLAGGTVANANATQYTVTTADFTLNNPTRAGYTFTGWTGTGLDGKVTEVTVTKGSTGARSYTATWEANDIETVVNYHWQNIDDNGYTLKDTVKGTVKNDTVFAPGVKTYEGFVSPAAQSVEVKNGVAVTIDYYYTRETHTVTLTAGTGIDSVSGAGDYRYGKEITVLAEVSKGYTWQNWTADGTEASAAKEYTITIGTADISLTANATLDTYTIAYAGLDGIDAPLSNPTEYNVHTEEIVLANPEKTGYTFTGWTGTDLSEATMTVKIASGSVGNRTYTANWSKNTYNLSFDLAGGAYKTGESNPSTYTVTDNITICNPEKTGYTFDGWQNANDPTAEKIQNIVLNGATGDRSYVATWKENTDTAYTVNHFFMDLNGHYANSPTSTDENTVGTTGAQIAYAPRTEEGFTVDYATNENGEKTTEFFINPDGSSVVNYYYSRNQYTLTYYTVEDELLQESTLYFGATVPVAPTAVREGYTFNGWNLTIPATMPSQNLEITAQWTINQYTITFANTGDKVIDAVTQDYGTAVQKPADPTRTGYTFAGWDVEIPETMPAKDMTVTAQWTINQYTVTFNTDGGTAIEPITQDYGTAIVKPADPTKTGYTFAGWDKAVPATMPADNVTITAKWTVNQYTVTYAETGDTVIAPVTADYGTAIVKPADPTKLGYTFTGWDKAIPETMPAENMTITATWTINNYTITFDPADGIVDPASKGYTVEDEITDLPTPTRAGYTFNGWKDANGIVVSKINKGTTGDFTLTADWSANEQTYYVDLYYMTTAGDYSAQPETLTNKADTDTSVSFHSAEGLKDGFTFDAANSSLSGIVPGTGTLRLTAKYIRNRYTVTYDFANGAEKKAVTTYYEAELETIANPTRTGYTFAGWMNGKGEIAALPDTMPLNGETYTAQWTADEYTLTLDENGGTAVEDIVYDIEDTVTLPALTRDGYFFRGWKVTTEDGNWLVADENYSAGTPVSGKYGFATLTAQWTTVQYTLSFDTRGGTVDQASLTYNIEENKQLPTPVRPGYTFTGWNVTAVSNVADDSGNVSWIVGNTYDAGTTVKDTYGNATFEALWSPNTYNVSADTANITYAGADTATVDVDYTATLTPDAGYTLPDTVTVTIGGKDAIVNTDYTYTLNADGTATFTLIPARIIGDVAIKVVRNIITYTISYNLDNATTDPKNDTDYTVEETVTLTAPERIGYTFLGWTGSNGTTPETTVTIAVGSTGDKNYVANWSANLNDCVVEHYQQNIGGNGWTLVDTETTQQYTDTYFEPVVNDYEGFASPVQQKVLVDGAGAVTVRYEYTRNQYNLTVEGCDGVSVAVGTSEVWYGQDVTVTAVVAMGYTWTGWTLENVSADDAKALTLNFPMPASDVTLTATATLDIYDISYDLAGGELENGVTNPDSYTVISDTFTLINPTKRGYVFTGWTGSNGETPSTDVTITNNSATGDKFYTANWKAIDYSVTYTMNSGDNHKDNPATYTVEDTVVLQIPTRTGYTFAGWTDTDTGETVTQIGPNATGEVKLTANWTADAHTYTVEYRTMTTEGVYAEMADKTETIDSYTDAEVSVEVTPEEGFYIADTSLLSGTVKSDDSLVLKVYIGRKQYNVSLADGGDGISSVNTNTTLVYFDAPVEVNAAVENGYTFEKWTSADAAVLADSENNPYSFRMPASDVILTATATLDEYKINYTLNDGTNDAANPDTYTVLETINIRQPAKLGYTFTGWSGSYYGKNVVIAKGTTGDINLIANWDINTYTVTYDLAGGSVNGTNPATYNVHDSFTLINPTRAGYDFAGWTGSFAGENVTVPENTTGNLTFTAKWTARTDTKYTVNYYIESVNGDNTYTLSEESYVAEYTSDKQLTVTAPARTGFTTPVAQTKTITADGLTVFNFYYERNQYTYTFKAIGYDDVVKTYFYEYPVTKPEDPTRTGYEFISWNPVVAGTMPAHDVTSVAEWKAITYTVGYDLAGGSVTGNPTSYTVENGFTLSNPVRNGYDFAGWTGTGLTEATMLVKVEAGSIGNRSYTATWTPVRYEISYDFAGGTDNGVNPISYTIEDSITLVNPTKVGYTFAGWTGTGIAGSSMVVSFRNTTGNRSYTASWRANNDTLYTVLHYQQNIGSNTYTLFETEELYGTTMTEASPKVKTYPGFTAPTAKTVTILPDGSAKVEYYYTRNTYTIFFDSNGGSAVSSKTFAFGESLAGIETPSYLGYTFAGWIPALPETMTAGNLYVTADWKPNADTPYTVYHYFQDVDCISYPDSLMKTEYCYGETGAIVEVATWDVEGFTAPEKRSIVIAADGSRTVRYYYTRNTYTVTFVDHNDNILAMQSVVYGLPATPPELAGREPDEFGHYTFAGWSEDTSFIHGYTTIKAMYTSEAHNPGEEADCTRALVCTVCGYEIAPANGHMPVVHTPAVEATCTTAGNTADSVCSVCGEILSRYAVVAALGHEIGSWYVDVPATATATGVLKRVCSRCDWSETHEIPILSDTPVVSIDITTQGSQAYVGTSYQLKTSIKPSNAGNKQVIWESSDPSVASVTKDGYITSHKPGEVTFTVTTLDGLKTDSITINFFYSAEHYDLVVLDLFACNLTLDGKPLEATTGQIIRVKAGSTLAFTINPTTAEYLEQGGYIFTANGSNVEADANGVYYIYNVHENIEISALPAIGKPSFDDDQQYDTDEVPEKSIFAKILAFFERIMEWFRNLFK